MDAAVKIDKILNWFICVNEISLSEAEGKGLWEWSGGEVHFLDQQLGYFVSLLSNEVTRNINHMHFYMAD